MKKVRKSTFNYLVDILGDYPYIDEHIKRREYELRHPHRGTDINAGIKGNKAIYDTQDAVMITIEQDWRLACLERNKRAIMEVLEDSDKDTQTIIHELYLKRRPEYTMQGLVDANRIYCSRAKAFYLRDMFFIRLAQWLNLEV